MPPPEALATTLPDELMEEIFLRLPPDEPAWLVRASLASKPWHGILTGPRFRGRYLELHSAPPMLGFLHCSSSPPGPPFVPTTRFGACFPNDKDRSGWYTDLAVFDCRQGRVLLYNQDVLPLLLYAWDPMTGRRREFTAPQIYDCHGAAVLCNVTGCNHQECHEGPFRVVLVGLVNTDGGCVANVHVSLPEVGEWSNLSSTLDLAVEDALIVTRPPVFIQDALYFRLTYHGGGGYEHAILKYDLSSNCLSLIDAPPQKIDTYSFEILMAMEDGSLGFAHLDGLTLYLWSRQMGSNGVAAWTQRTFMDLKNILPIQNPKNGVRLIGSVEGTDIVFLTTDLGIYEINLKSLQWKKIWGERYFYSFIPYRSFYNQPGRATPCEAEH